MATTAVNPTVSNSATTTTRKKETEATQSNFMTLLVAQLRNQDPLNPATNEEFIAQLAQLQSLDESRKMSSSLATIVSTQTFSSASTLIGKKVSGVTTNVSGDSINFNGVVSAVSQVDGKVKIKVTQDDGNVIQVDPNEISEIMQPNATIQ